jgi:hypothetical protein
MRRKFIQFTPLTCNGWFLYFRTPKYILCYAIDSLCLNFFHLLARKPNLENFSIYSNKFFYNFHLSKSRFTCSGLWKSGLARRLHWLLFDLFNAWQPMTFIRRVAMKLHSADVLTKGWGKHMYPIIVRAISSKFFDWTT